jgi:hypothetical protein
MYADLVHLLESHVFQKYINMNTLRQYKGIARPAVNSRTAGHVTGEARVKVSSAKTRLKKKQTP